MQMRFIILKKTTVQSTNSGNDTCKVITVADPETGLEQANKHEICCLLPEGSLATLDLLRHYVLKPMIHKLMFAFILYRRKFFVFHSWRQTSLKTSNNMVLLIIISLLNKDNFLQSMLSWTRNHGLTQQQPALFQMLSFSQIRMEKIIEKQQKT